MEHLETQASDLRYLAQAPVSDTASVSYQTPRPGTHGSPDSASYGDNSAPSGGNANKRKSTDEGMGNAKGTRSKRNRYISIACNECKRRKIKCNGETPCQRCGNLNLACLYAPNCCSNSFKDSHEFKSFATQLTSLQDQVNWLSTSLQKLQNQESRLNLSGERSATTRQVAGTTSGTIESPTPSALSGARSDLSANRPQPFHGPTSMAFMLDVANQTISNMGYKGIEGDEDNIQPALERPQPFSQSQQHDPLMDFDETEMIRLCRLHEDEVGIMYPVLSIQSVIEHARSISAYMENMAPHQSHQPFNDQKTLELKMVMCCALVVEEHGLSDRSQKLYHSMENILNRKMMCETVEVSDLPAMALLAGYRFLQNEEVLAWRVIGHITRLCVELGIHQIDGLNKIRGESERKNALNTFWSAYVLDRRWAFGTGLSYTLPEQFIDPGLPLPDYPYLAAMVTYSRIGVRVWGQVSKSGPVLSKEFSRHEIDHLNDEIIKWYGTVPDEVRVQSWDELQLQLTSTSSYNLKRLRLWTYLRYHQIRLWLYTPVLHSATSIMENPEYAQRVVELAKDTIRNLASLNNNTDLYRRSQIFYHQFLASAIAVVFLASVHAPVRFSSVCREEFYTGLELVRDLSAKSWVSQRLWNTISSLKDVAPRFGLNPDDDAHSNAALGMIGLARGSSRSTVMRPDEFNSPSIGTSSAQSAGTTTETNGSMIQMEMSRIFEGYVGLNGYHFNPHNPPPQGTPHEAQNMGETLYQQLREMF